MSQHNVVILGGNFAGLEVAHYILRHTFPALESLGTGKTFHLTLVTPNDSFFFKVAAPRAAVSPELIPQSKVFVPFSEGFANYPASHFTRIQGKATGVDAGSRTVEVTAVKGGEKQSIHYDSLVIATGTSGDPLWTITDDLKATHAAFAKSHEQLKKAKTIIVAGGGPAGVELSGELASQYPKLNIALYPGSERVLPRLSQKSSARATVKLEALKVQVKPNLKVNSSKQGSEGGWEVVFSDGSSKQADIYYDCTGGKPNTSFLPKEWLNEGGSVLTDNLHMRATNAGERVYAVGDAASYSNRGLIDLQGSITPTASSVGHDIAKLLGKEEATKTSKALKDKKFSTMANTQLVPVGPSGGVGQIMGWSVPSLLVWFAKSKTFFMERAREPMEGAHVKSP